MKRLFDLSQASTGKLFLIVVVLYSIIAAITWLAWK